jgi:hypothetical protein
MWTGADGATDATWQNSVNWDGGNVPNGVTNQLSTDSSLDEVIFDSETALYMPSDGISTRSSWTGSFKNPQIQVLNGEVTFNGVENWGWSGITSFTVGDGDMTILAVADTDYRNLNRDPNGTKTYVVNADGTLKFRRSASTWSSGGSKDAQIQLNGGAALFAGTISGDFVSDAGDFVSFNSAGSTLTADFGGSFADLTAITDQFAAGFVDTTGNGLAATDNLDGTYTISVVPEPTTTALLGLGGLALILRRRKQTPHG